jgi:hypothetical protein
LIFIYRRGELIAQPLLRELGGDEG